MICHCAEFIPNNVDQVVLLWQGGGSKLQYTKVHPVSKSTGTAVFESNTQLRQVCTLRALGQDTTPFHAPFAKLSLPLEVDHCQHCAQSSLVPL